MFEERNQRCRHRYYLAWRYVHQRYFVRRLDGKFVLVTHGYQIIGQLAVFDLGAGLGDNVIGFFDRGQEDDLVGHLGVTYTAVRAFQEAVLVGTGIGGQRVDQTDVRAFRRFDRTYATVVGRVYVTDFEASTLTGQTARPKSRNTALVGNLGQRVVLVHELGQLAGTEELLHCRRYRLGIDQILRHQAFAFGHGQTFLDRTLYAHQANTELVLGHLANRTDTAVTQVIDVVDHALAVTDIHQGLEDLDDIFLAQHAGAFDLVATDAAVELHAAYGRKIVTIAAEEQIAEQGLGSVLGRRLTGTHHAVDLDQRFELSRGAVDTQGIGNERTAVDVVGVQGLETLDFGLLQLGDQISGDFHVAIDNDLACGGMHDRLGDGPAEDVVERHFQAVDTGFLELVDMPCSDTTPFLDNDLALVVLDVEGGNLATQALWHQLELQVFTLHLEDVGVIEDIQDFVSLVAQSAQQHGGRQLAATVDTDKDRVLGIKLEVQP